MAGPHKGRTRLGQLRPCRPDQGPEVGSGGRLQGTEGGGEVVAAEDCPVSSSDLAAWPAMRTPPAGFVDSPQLHSGDRAVCLWHSFLGCRNSENFLVRPSPVFVSSFESLLCPPAPAGVCGGPRASGP